MSGDHPTEPVSRGSAPEPASRGSAPELRLSLDWELWVIEQLLFSVRIDELVRTLAEQGVEPELARSRIRELALSPSYARLAARLGEARLAAKLQRLQAELEGEINLCRRPSIERERLLAEHWIRSRPLLLTEAARSMRAVQTWSLAELARRFPTLELEVNIDRSQATRPAETETRSARILLPELIARIEAGPSNDFYVVSRNGLFGHPELRELWDELDPLPDFLSPPQFPRGISLWIGPAGTLTPPHFDPHNVLLVQVQGRKRIRLAPRLRAPLHVKLSGYYLDAPLERVFAPEQILEVVLEPGMALFVPVAWFHEVLALEPSMTLSCMNFCWPNDFHWLA